MASPPPAVPDGDPAALAALTRERGAQLLDALEEHLPGSREHAESTGAYAFAAAAGMGLERASAELYREAAKLHEIGRLYEPTGAQAAGLSGEGAQQEAQPAAPGGEGRAGASADAPRDTHAAGAALARGAGLPAEICEWLEAAGERYDGAGPRALAGDAIPIASRIIRAACECDRLVREPGAEVAPQQRIEGALAGLRARAGRELDPDVVRALGEVLGEARAQG